MAELNVFSAALNPQVWTNYMQDVLMKSLVSFQVADTSLAPELKVGDRVHVPYFVELTATNYDPGNAITITGVTATDDYIDVRTKKVAPFYINYLCTLGETLSIKLHKFGGTLFETIPSQTLFGEV